MSIKAEELKQWINSLPSGTSIGIDEGGLTLQVVGNPEVYLEIGGLPEEDPKYPRSDWQYEVSNGDTSLGYDEWLEHKIESE